MKTSASKASAVGRKVASHWERPAVITKANLFDRSFANWAFNPIDGCSFACPFCCVPEVSTCKMAPQLAQHGINSPDGEWGNYQLLRTWDEERFLKSLDSAWDYSQVDFASNWRSAILMSSTTDPYQPIIGAQKPQGRQLQRELNRMRRRVLRLILEHSPNLVRVLTRSPLACCDFDLFKQFGPRLTFGMSVPTLREDLIRVYEPDSPPASERIKTLRRAKENELPFYIVMPPIYPDCDQNDLQATLKAVAELNPITIFCEPLNVRGSIEARVLNCRAGSSPAAVQALAGEEAWQDYAIGCLRTVQVLSDELGILERIHLWPPKSLGNEGLIQRMPDPSAYRAWLDHWWRRESEWPLVRGVYHP